jgi:hypothetical protein
MVLVSENLLQELEACALRSELDVRKIQSLREEVKKLEGALGQERLRCDKQAAAFASGTRTFESLARDLEAQYATKLSKIKIAHDGALAAKDIAVVAVETRLAELEASHARAIAAKDAAYTKLERDHAALRADAAAQLTATYAAVTSKLALEVHPGRADGRQFAMLHVGPVPVDTFRFDSAWCLAACGDKWLVDIDPVTHMRAHVTTGRGWGHVTLRGGAPLPRHLFLPDASPPRLPSYRVVIEAYPAPIDGKNTQYCNVGFVPSHACTDGTLLTPVVGHSIHNYGGWFLQLRPESMTWMDARAGVFAGWKPVAPRAATDAAVDDTSPYARTVPRVPAGSAVEFAVDYGLRRRHVSCGVLHACGRGRWLRGGAVRRNGASLCRNGCRGSADVGCRSCAFGANSRGGFTRATVPGRSPSNRRRDLPLCVSRLSRIHCRNRYRNP